MKTSRTSRAKSPAKALPSRPPRPPPRAAAARRSPRKATAARAPAAATATGAVIRSATQRKSPRLRESLQSVAAATVKQPGKLARGLQRAGAELLSVVRGASTLEPAPGDRRFDDPTWRDNAVYRRLMQGHLALARESHRLAGELGLAPRDEARARMALGIVADTLAPTNTLLGNPAAIKRTLETGGRNLVSGVLNLVSDWRHNGGLPAMVDVSKFKVGENLAVTAGDVVYRNAQLELIQYRPQTPTVHGTPLFIVPPQINKYYVWDLAPGRSLIEFLVQQGFSVYVVSWFNPRATESAWGLETYVLSLEQAMRVTREISRAPQMHVLGACSGGITSAALLAYLAAKRVDWARSLSLLVAILDIDGIADSSMGLFANLETLDIARTLTGARGVLEGKDLAKVFAWLRPNDLIWNYWVNNYLMGQKPADLRRAVLECRHHAIAGTAAHRLPGAAGVQRVRAGRRRHARRQGARPRGGALRQLHPGRPHRPHHAMGRLLPDAPAARRAQRVRAQRQRPRAVDRQPTGQQEELVRRQRRRARLAAGLRARRRGARRQLVAAPDAVARRPFGRRQARAATAGSRRHPPLCAAPGTYVMARG